MHRRDRLLDTLAAVETGHRPTLPQIEAWAPPSVSPVSAKAVPVSTSRPVSVRVRRGSLRDGPGRETAVVDLHPVEPGERGPERGALFRYCAQNPGCALAGLVNRCALMRTVGSNPTPSANFLSRINN